MKKYLVLLVIIICSVFGFSQQKTNSSQPTLSTDLTVQMNLRTDLEIYKGKVDTVSAHISALQDRQDKRIDSIETFIYWILGLLSCGIAFLTLKSSRDYKKAIKDLNEAQKTVQEAKHLQEEAKRRLLKTLGYTAKVQKLALKSIEQAQKITKQTQSTIEQEISKGRERITSLIDDEKERLNTLVSETSQKVFDEIQKRNKVDSLIRDCEDALFKEKGDDVEKLVLQILKLDSNHPKGHYFQALLYSKYYGISRTPNFQLALDSINRAIQLDASESSYFRLRSYITAALGYKEQALEDIHKAQELGGNLEQLKLEEIEIAVLLGDIEKAKQLLKGTPASKDYTYKIGRQVLSTVISTLENNPIDEELKLIIFEYEQTDMAFPWDFAEIMERVKANNSPFSNQQKQNLTNLYTKIENAIKNKETSEKAFISKKHNTAT